MQVDEATLPQPPLFVAQRLLIATHVKVASKPFGVHVYRAAGEQEVEVQGLAGGDHLMVTVIAAVVSGMPAIAVVVEKENVVVCEPVVEVIRPNATFLVGWSRAWMVIACVGR